VRPFKIKLKSVSSLISCLASSAVWLSGCATQPPKAALQPRAELADVLSRLKPVSGLQPAQLRLKADLNKTEKVEYAHAMSSRSYDNNQLRAQKDERFQFTSQAETLAVDDHATDGRFTQLITVLQKDGDVDLHDFALPDLGEKLEVIADSRGRILKAGEYPNNSIFYVPPISLPENAVSVGDTWQTQSAWLSLSEMVPYQLDMVSILKALWHCGSDTCAEIELSGEVRFQGALSKALSFQSTWRGRMLFDIERGTVVWSRTDSDERFLSDQLRRDVSSCLEAVLIEPREWAVAEAGAAHCDPVVEASDGAVSGTASSKP
jgi:hypothetical protein